MDQLLFEDLVDKAGILRAIDELRHANEKFGNEAVAINERIRGSLSLLKSELADYKNALLSINSSQRGAKDQVAGLKDGIQQATASYRTQNEMLRQNEALFQNNARVVDAMQKRLAGLRNEYEGLDLSQRSGQKRAREITRELTQTSRAMTGLTKATQQAAGSVKAAAGSYDALDKQTKKLRADLKGMADAFDLSTGKLNRNNRAAVDLFNQIQKNDRALKTMDGGFGVHSRHVGDYGVALGGLSKSLLGVAGGIVGITSVLDAAQAAFGVLSNMERINAGLRAASRDSADFARTQRFLINLSNELGQRYDVLAVSYKNLSAATRNTALEGAATKRIFESVIKAGTALQLSNEEIEGSLYALTQMISKGKVSAEELRQQLGERLPGSMRLMAQAMGVSEAKLNKMMEAGQLLAVEVLPKLATELDKTFGKDAAKNADTMAAGWNRLTNQVQLFIASFNENGKVSRFFGTILTGLADVFADLRYLVESDEWSQFFSYVTGNVRAVDRTRRERKEEEKYQRKIDQFGQMSAPQREATLARQADDIVGLETELARLKQQKQTKETKQRQEAIKQEISRQKQLYGILWTENRRLKEEEQVNAQRQQQARKEQAEIDKEKRRSKLDAELRQALDRLDADTDARLAELEKKQQDGLVTEQEYLEQRLKITQAGIRQRQTLLTRAGKKETDDYKQTVKEKLEAETDYQRAKLKLDLKNVQGRTEQQVADLDLQRNEGTITEQQYVDRRHKVILDGLEEEKRIIREAGQEKTQLYRDVEQKITEENARFAKDRVDVLKRAWRKELEDARDKLRDVDTMIGEELSDNLFKVDQNAALDEQKIQLDVGRGNITKAEGETRLHKLRIRQIEEQNQALRQAYERDVQFSNAVVDMKIQALEKYKAEANRTPKEIAEGENQIDELRRLRDEDRAKDKKKLDREVAQNEIKHIQEVTQEELKELEKRKAAREQLRDLIIQGGADLVNGILELQQAETQNEIQQLENRKEKELEMAGESASGKEAIEKKYDEERKRLQRQQDIQERQQALFNIGIATAQAVMKTYADFGFPAGVPLAIAQGALGLLQAGIVLATPLPQYAGGKNIDAMDSYSGLAIAGEAGREIWQHDGVSQLLSRPTLIDVGANDRIYPNDITEQLLNDSQAVEASHILHRTGVQQQAADRRDQLRMKEPVRSSGSGADTNQVTAAIRQGFAGTEVHQWQVLNGELVRVVANGQTSTIKRQSRHRLGR